MHKNPGNWDYYKYMAFMKILETAHGSQFWSVPSQFYIFWSPGSAVQCSAVQSSAEQYRAVQRNQSSKVQNSAEKSSTVQCTTVYFNVLQNVIKGSTAQCSAV